MANNELRLQLIDKNGEIEILKEELTRLKYEKAEEQVILRRQIVGLQGRCRRGEEEAEAIEASCAQCSRQGSQGNISQPLSEVSHNTPSNSNSKLCSLADNSSVEHKEHRFRLKSFRSSMGNLREESCSSSSCSFPDPCSSGCSLRSKLEQLETKVEQLSDQQKLLRFKNKLLEMKIK